MKTGFQSSPKIFTFQKKFQKAAKSAKITMNLTYLSVLGRFSQVYGIKRSLVGLGGTVNHSIRVSQSLKADVNFGTLDVTTQMIYDVVGKIL